MKTGGIMQMLSSSVPSSCRVHHIVFGNSRGSLFLFPLRADDDAEAFPSLGRNSQALALHPTIWVSLVGSLNLRSTEQHASFFLHFFCPSSVAHHPLISFSHLVYGRQRHVHVARDWLLLNPTSLPPDPHCTRSIL